MAPPARRFPAQRIDWTDSGSPKQYTVPVSLLGNWNRDSPGRTLSGSILKSTLPLPT